MRLEAQAQALPEVFAPRVSNARAWHLVVGQAALLFGVGVYLLVVLLGPLLAFAAEIVHLGFLPVLAALRDPEIYAALQTTGLLAVIAVLVNAVVGTALALFFVRQRFALRHLVYALANLPLAVSPVMVGLAFMLLFGREGLLAPVLAFLSLKVVFAFPALVLATLFVTLPLCVAEVAYVLEEIGTSEEEAAVTLGATPWQTFWRVTMPNIRVPLLYGLLMTVSRTLGEFGAVLVLGGGIRGATQTATTFIHAAVEERNLAAAYAMAAVLALLSVALLLGFEASKTMRRRELS